MAITWSSHVKYFDVTIARTLNLRKHVQNIVKKSTSTIGHIIHHSQQE